MSDPIEDEVDAAMASLGTDYSYAKAVLEGFALRRPALVCALPALTRIAPDRLSAATGGQTELTGDEIDRVADVAHLSPLELAWATTGSDGSELGELAARVVESDARLFRSQRAASDKATGVSLVAKVRRVS